MSKTLLITLILCILVGTWWLWKEEHPLSVTDEASNITLDTKNQNETITSEVTLSQNDEENSNIIVYRNDEWSFQFRYPPEWYVSENSFKGEYTKFSLTLFPVEGKYFSRPVLVHIVESKFVENSFKNLDKTEEKIVIDGVTGIKYTYKWKGDTETAVILPLKEYQIILGTNGHYPDLYENFLNSFEFIK